MSAIRRIPHNQSCLTRSVLRWTGNSCYIDTVLWVLLNTKISFVDKKMLFSQIEPKILHAIGTCDKELNDLNERVFMEFQTELKKIAQLFRTGKKDGTCTSFRRLYEKWYTHPQCARFAKKSAFHETEQQEAQEFLQFILSLFGMNGILSHGAVSSQSFYYGISMVPRTTTVWKFINKRIDKKQSIIWSVPFQILSRAVPDKRSLSDFLVNSDDLWNISRTHGKCTYNSIRTVHSLDKFANLLIISVDRIHPATEMIIHRRLHIDPFLTDKRGKRLHLVGVICHKGDTFHAGHYTAFALCQNEWFYYDDLNPPLKKVGTIENLFNIRHISSHGILFFYST